MAGYFWNGPKNPCYYGAVFAFKTEDHTSEGEIKLMAASEVAFEDNGHAIAWAMAH